MRYFTYFHIHIWPTKQHKKGQASTHQLSYDECVIHEVQQGCLGVNVVEGVGSFEALMSRVVHDRRGQRVEAQEVSQFPTGALRDKGDVRCLLEQTAFS